MVIRGDVRDGDDGGGFPYGGTVTVMWVCWYTESAFFA
jgi:hypothetical protein